MKTQLLFLSVFLLIISCGPSEKELQAESRETIRESKEQIDEYFEEVLDEYIASNEQLDETFSISLIESFTNSEEIEVAEYAQKHLDSVQKLKESLLDIIYGNLYEYAEEQGWDKMSKSEFEKLEETLKVKGDEFSKSQLYEHPSSPKFINKNGFYLYYLKTSSDSNPIFALKAQYLDDDWLFIESAEASVDGALYSLDIGNWERDNSGGKIYEWGFMRNPSYNLIVNIIKSKTTKIRYDGSKYYDDRTISSTQKSAMKDVLQVYYGLYLKKA
ncbi:hypothetical protein N9528_01200 [Crocinitomicaceae bacterium]|nr:hypothetical protein [Crocinitomicaceae bacterium]